MNAVVLRITRTCRFLRCFTYLRLWRKHSTRVDTGLYPLQDQVLRWSISNSYASGQYVPEVRGSFQRIKLEVRWVLFKERACSNTANNTAYNTVNNIITMSCTNAFHVIHVPWYTEVSTCVYGSKIRPACMGRSVDCIGSSTIVYYSWTVNALNYTSATANISYILLQSVFAALSLPVHWNSAQSWQNFFSNVQREKYRVNIFEHYIWTTVFISSLSFLFQNSLKCIF